MEERRRANRRKLVSKLVVKRLDQAETEEVEIEIVDVSKSGIGFQCDQLLGIGAVYEGFLRIWTQEVIHAFLEIVRIEKKENGFHYGAIFIGMPESDASRIEVYDMVESLKQEK
ncbi:MAG: PilZ domain-containing protein [Lachnospiraceae bacterium]|nr:PilZ domain-containing protein [Lachnospiraceae bacterium]